MNIHKDLCDVNAVTCPYCRCACATHNGSPFEDCTHEAFLLRVHVWTCLLIQTTTVTSTKGPDMLQNGHREWTRLHIGSQCVHVCVDMGRWQNVCHTNYKRQCTKYCIGTHSIMKEWNKFHTGEQMYWRRCKSVARNSKVFHSWHFRHCIMQNYCYKHK